MENLAEDIIFKNNLPEVNMIIPTNVIEALNSERLFHKSLKIEGQDILNLETELLLIRKYSEIAIDSHLMNGKDETIDKLRELGGILCRCLENHGVKNRSYSLTPNKKIRRNPPFSD